jgi:hypothetical protein
MWRIVLPTVATAVVSLIVSIALGVDFAECAPGSKTDRTGCSYPNFLAVVIPTGIVLALLLVDDFRRGEEESRHDDR